MDKPTHVLLVAGLVVGIIVGLVYIVNHQPRVDCWNFFGLTKGCSASVVPAN